MTKQQDSQAAASAARTLVEAAKTARDVVAEASRVAAAIAAKANTQNDQTTKALVDALRIVFGEYEETQRFVDVSRIPLLCKSVIDINLRLTSIETQLRPIFWGVSLISGAVILAVVGAILNMIIK